MVQVIEMTYQEKYDMYMKLKKDEIIKMLIESNRHLSQNTYTAIAYDYSYSATSTCIHDNCADCNGTGYRKGGGLCVHSISCPCPKCSPT